MPVSDGETTITRATCGSMKRAIAQALPVTSSATWSRRSRLRANNSSASGFVSIRPPERSTPSSTSATSQKSRWTSSATALNSQLPSSPDSRHGEPVGKQHRRIRARSATGQVAGAATEKPGLKPTVQNRLPNPRPPKRPTSQSPEPKPAARCQASPQGTVSCPEKQERQAPADLVCGSLGTQRGRPGVRTRSAGCELICG